jgi:CRISPR-associated endonuclease Cas1
MVLSPTIESPASERVASIFQQSPVDTRVWIAHGYGIRVGVWNHQLEVCDGIGRTRRTRKLPMSDRSVKRLLITGREGYVTLAALRWCHRHDISVHVIDAQGDLVASHVPTESHTGNVKLLRTQAMAGPDGPLEDKGIEISRYLLTVKLRSQSRNAFTLLDNPQTAMKIDHYADMLSDATTYPELNWLEAQSANLYFAAWQTAGVHIPWTKSELKVIPANWLAFGNRKSEITKSGARSAVDPVNAMLNYAYMIGYAESRVACIGASLNPQLGFMHADNDDRDSLALDILETIRPDIDAFILGMLGYGHEPRVFSSKEFRQPDNLSPGTIRLVPPLTHEIAGQSMIWQDTLQQMASQVAGILGAPIGKTGRLSRTLAAQKAEFQSMPVDIDAILPVEVYETVFKPIVPSWQPKAKGNRPILARNILAAMIHLERHHVPWAHIPQSFNVSHRTLKMRRLEWQRAGVWDAINSAVGDLASKSV